MINNKNETNIYYTLKQIETYNLTTLRYRQLKNRIKELITINDSSIGNLIYKASNRWYIHISMIDKFRAIRTHDKTKTRAINYKNEISINLPLNYDKGFYSYLGKTISTTLKGSKTIYSVEPSKTTNTNRFHLHMGTTATNYSIVKKLKQIETKFNLSILDNKNTMIQPIRNITQFVNYISKQNVITT